MTNKKSKRAAAICWKYVKVDSYVQTLQAKLDDATLTYNLEDKANQIERALTEAARLSQETRIAQTFGLDVSKGITLKVVLRNPI